LHTKVPGIHAGRAVAFGIYDERAGTEEVVIIAEVDVDGAEERQSIAECPAAAHHQKFSGSPAPRPHRRATMDYQNIQRQDRPAQPTARSF